MSCSGSDNYEIHEFIITPSSFPGIPLFASKRGHKTKHMF